MSTHGSSGGPAEPETSGSIIWALGSTVAAVGLSIGIFLLLFNFVDRRNASMPGQAPAPAVVAQDEPINHAQPDFDEAALQRGEMLFTQNCVACHGKDLRGGTGFNLVDAEWVHGSSREEILANIKSGFPDKGMIGFDSILTEEQISDVIDYIQSRREGWESVSYAIWPLPAGLDPESNTDFDAITDEAPAKSGTFTDVQADFGVPEREDYVISIEGTAYFPEGDQLSMWISGGAVADLEVRIDGEVVEPVYDPTGTNYPIEPGLREVEISYSTLGKYDWFSNDLVIIATNPDTGAREFPMSEAGRRIIETTSHVVDASGRTRVVRRRVKNMPASTVSVGMPVQKNYGFNTRTCSVVGMWDGDFLDIGPNIDGRGQSPSFPLGDWVFHEPEGIALDTEGDICDYTSMSMQPGGAPAFHFVIGDVAYTMSTEESRDGMAFIFASDDGTPVPALTVPNAEGFTARLDQGTGQGSSSVRVTLSRVEEQ